MADEAEKKIAEERAEQAKKEKAQRFGAAFRLFDRGLMEAISKERNRLSDACDVIDKKIKHAEKKVVAALLKQRRICDDDLALADKLVQKELRSKVITSQWTNSFLATSDDEYLDPVSYAFSRFALNMCLCYTDVNAEYILQSRVHVLLVGLMNFSSELIVGPAIMATTHISLYPEVKPELILAGVLPALLNLFVRTESQPILTQACKLCGSLALFPANKAHLVNSGVLHALLDLTGGAHKIVNKHTQLAAATAVVNCVYNSDTNRSLIIEVEGIRPIMSAMRLSSDDDIILQCLKAVNNTVYCNSFTAGKFLTAGADTVIVEILETTDSAAKPAITHARLSTLSNFCNSEATQSHVASGTAVDSAVTAVRHSGQPIIIAEALNLFYALAWNNLGNKAVLAARGCVESSFEVLVNLAHDDSEFGAKAYMKAGSALASMLIYPSNHEKILKLKGLAKLVKVAKGCDKDEKLLAIGKVIAMMVPSPEIILKNHMEECEIPVEKAQCHPCLKKIKLANFGHGAAPEWLEKAVRFLVLSDFELSNEPHWEKQEYDDKLVNFKELWTDVLPDADIFTDTKLGSLLMTVY